MAYLSDTEIKSKLDAISTAIDTVLSGGKSYRLNDSQGDIQVTRSSLKELRDMYSFYEAMLYEDVDGIVSIKVGR